MYIYCHCVCVRSSVFVRARVCVFVCMYAVFLINFKVKAFCDGFVSIYNFKKCGWHSTL